jgi:hypothetical protein
MGYRPRYRTRLTGLALAAAKADIPLRVYHCDRCRQYHLTSRIKTL